MIAALLMVAAAIAGGTLLTWWLHEGWPWPVRLAAGAALGVALQGVGGVAGAFLFGIEAGALPLAVLVSLAPFSLLARRDARAGLAASLRESLRGVRTRAFWTSTRRRDALAALLGLAALLLVFDRAVVVSPDGLATGVAHNFGDLPFHLAVASGFAWGDNFPPEHPELAGARLTYPYLVDFVAALWARAGLALPRAFRWQHVVLAPALLVLLRQWGLALTRDRRAARLVPALVLLSGGLGFAWFVAAAPRSLDGLADFLGHLPRDYTIDGEGPLRWGNSVLTLLIPQRGFLLALPLVLLVWSLWADALDVAPPADGALRDDARARARLGRAGLVAGLLPLVHGHSFASVLALAGALALLFPARRAFAAFFAGALAPGLPQALLLASGSSLQATHFVGLQTGWDRGGRDPVVFWLLNTGALLPLIVIAFAWRGRNPLTTARLRRFQAPFALLFIVPNLLRLSPWIWDNVKFLFLWFVGAVPLVALVLARLDRGGRLARGVAAVLLIVLTLAGALDLWRVASRQVLLPLFDADGLRFAQAVTRAVPKHARILHWPTHDAPTLLSGRPAVLGYPGHIWSQGLDSGQRAEEIMDFYLGSSDAGRALRRYGVDYVVLGPRERGYTSPARLRDLATHPVAADVGAYRLYDVRRARQP